MKLQDLIIKEKELDRSLLTEILAPNIRIASDSGKIRFTAERTLSNKQRALLYLLGKKASFLLQVSSREKTSPQEIANNLGITGGSLRPTLMRLLKDGLVENDSGEYRVPNHVLDKVKIVIFNEDDEIPF